MARESQTSRTRDPADPLATMNNDDVARLALMRRALLEQRVRAAGALPAAQPAPAAARTAPGPLPLSASQSQLWYLSQLAPDSRVFSEVIEIRKTGALDVEALRRALSEVIARHEALRTTFDCIDSVPHQIVKAATEVELPLSDLSHRDFDDAVQHAVRIVAADSLPAYDLAEGPLIRPRLIRLTDHDHRLYIGLHHLIWDGLTLNRVVFPELVALYRSYAMGVPSPLPEPESQYRDYTSWELEWVRGPEIAKRIERWRNRLAGITPTQLPVDHPRPARQTFAGGTLPLTINQATVDGLRSAARVGGGTLFHALAAAYAWWLRLYTESTEVVFGTPHDLRQRSDLFSVAGYAVTPVVVRCEVSGDESFAALVGRTGRAVTEALSDAVPFETLVAGLDVARDLRCNPLFQTALVLEPPLASSADDWALHLMETDVRDVVASSKFDLSIELDERPEGHVAGRFFFNTDLFDRETAQQMASHWVRVLEAVAAAPAIPMSHHDVITADERERQLTRHGKGQPEGSQHSACVHEIISAQVERTPDAPAVQVGDTTLSYRQLDDRASAIASQLAHAGAGPGAVVAVLLDRTPELVATLLGVLKSGAAFLPLDPRQPPTRNTLSVNDSRATIIVTDRRLPAGWDAVEATIVDLGESWSSHGSQVTVSPNDLAYVLYTSGSTGRPKGVLVEHRNLANLTRAMLCEFGLTGSDTVLSVASVTFDLAICDIFSALVGGARLVLASAEQATNPTALSRLIADAGATYMMATPTTWSALVAAGWRGEPNLTAASGGEALSEALADALQQRCRSVWNAWGPTETTVVATAARLAAGETITVGTPLAGVRVYIVDRNGRLQPSGVPGEIAVGGAGVARGYLNRPDEDARLFGDDPFDVGGRIYRTGDRGRLLPDGRIQHLGRYDAQLKIRGFRIEPGEIESTLCEHPDVGCCVVVARAAPSGDQQLIAYIVGDGARPSHAAARDWLRRRLPEYMVPSAFVHLSALPMTPSGKLDKAALPAPSPRDFGRSSAQPPRNDTERRVAALWAALLGFPVTNVNSDFFDVGGNSLLGARLIFTARREFGVALSLATFLDSGRTVAELAALIDTEIVADTEHVASKPPLHLVFADLASALSVRYFTAQWGEEQAVHALIPEQHGGRFDPAISIEQRAGRALSEIRARQPDGPLALAGYSIGGPLAYEIARQAVAAGQRVDWLGIIDGMAPTMSQVMQDQLTLRWRLRRIRRLPARERWSKYREVARRFLRSGGLWPHDDFDYRGATEIACSYRLPGHHVPTHLFVSEGTAAIAETNLLGWDEYHTGTLTAHHIGGDHVTILEMPLVMRLARMVLESLHDEKSLRHSNHSA